MNRPPPGILFAALAAALSGCAAPRLAPANPPAPVEAPAPPPPTSGAAPEADEPAPLIPPDVHPDGAEPVYRNPTIAVVHLRAHEDAAGRLFGPQIMYEVTHPGGWNVDAADKGAGYIPDANAETPAAAGALPKTFRLAAGTPGGPLLDPVAAARIVVTGLMRPDEQTQAESLAKSRGAGWSAVYDDEAGWLLIPR